MKKILNIIALLLIGVSVQAQDKAFDNINISYLSIGGGITNCRYETGFNGTPNGSFVADLGYIRMFKHGLGIGVGVRTTNMGSTVGFTKQFALQTGLVDAEGEEYDLSTLYSNVSEKHALWYVGLPVYLQYLHPFNDKLGLRAAVGLSVMLAVSSTYNTISGRIANEAYYPEWNVTLHDIDGIYDSHELALSSGIEPAYRKGGLALDLSAGLVYRLNSKINMTVGVAYSQMLTNILAEGLAESLVVQSLEERKALPYDVNLKIGLEYFGF